MSQKHFYGAVYGILEKDGKIAILQRQNTWYYDGGYCFPAWHIEEWETATQAMIREIDEEVGVVVNEEDITPIVILQRIADREYFDVCYMVKKREWEPHNKEENKASWLFRFDRESIPDYVAPEGKKFLEHYYTKGEELWFYILNLQ